MTWKWEKLSVTGFSLLPFPLQVPPGNNLASDYRLRVEGAGQNGGAIIFENETVLEFSRQFLSISISTNKAIYTGSHEVKVRAVMLTTALEPYTGIADLFILDPDGYIIRKWNSKELNNGVLIGTFQLPEYPKVRREREREQSSPRKGEALCK